MESNPYYFKFSPAGQFAIFLLLFGTGLILSSMLVTVTGSSRLSQVFASIISFLLTSFAFARICAQSNVLAYLGFKKSSAWKMFVFPLVGIIAAFPIAFLLNNINHMLPAPAWMINLENDAAAKTLTLLQQSNTIDLLLNLTVMALVPAVCEEVCFRGVVQQIAISAFNTSTGIILAALFFALIHLQFQGFLPRFYFGLVLGLMYAYSGTIWTSIVAHFIVNAVQLIALTN